MDEMSEGPVAPEVARGVQVPLPKRKKAFYRAEKRGDLLFPGLFDFQINRMMHSSLGMWDRLLMDSVLKPSPLMDLLAEENAPSGPTASNFQSVYGTISFKEKE